MAKETERKEPKGAGYRLEVPLDASMIEDKGTAGIAVKVVARDANAASAAHIVKLDRHGKARATFEIKELPADLSIYVGPADAQDVELERLPTLKANVSTRLWAGKHRLELAPLVIHPCYWSAWLRW